jgi:2'-5' RNA ligase
VSPLPERMADRWAEREMLPPGKGMLYWHVLFHDHPEVRAAVHEAHNRLAGIPGLKLVPHEWIHLTTLIAGYSHEISDAQMSVMIAEARRRLARLRPITVTLGRVLYHPEAIALEARPGEHLVPMHDAVRAATQAATGHDGLLAHTPWTPHVTVAYSTADGPAAPIINALGRRVPDREVTIDSISLVNQDGPETAWTWHPITEVPFGVGLSRLT